MKSYQFIEIDIGGSFWCCRFFARTSEQPAYFPAFETPPDGLSFGVDRLCGMGPHSKLELLQWDLYSMRAPTQIHGDKS